jgi:hypothetical protein
VPTFVATKHLPTACALILLATVAHADARVDRSVQAQAVATHSLLNPVTLIGEVIATLRKTIERSEVDSAALATAGLSVPFAADTETDRIRLVLAESELRVKLARDVQLRCDVTSRDEPNIDPELQLGIGVQFRFK